MIGALVEVGRGGLHEPDVEAFLSTASAMPAKLTAPASGLFLERVFYPGDDRHAPLVPALPVSTAAMPARAAR